MRSTKALRAPAAHPAEKLYYLMRIAVIAAAVFLFIPALNPARISGMINQNMSLLTSGTSYGSLIDEFGRAFRKEWVSEGSFKLLFAASLVACLGICASIAAGCMSLGNLKLKRLGNLFGIGGGVLLFGGLAGIFASYKQVAATSNPDRIAPMLPTGFTLLLVVAAVIFGISILLQLLLPRAEKTDKYEIEVRFQLFLMLLPFIALVAVFAYLPLWGWRYAFFDYKVGDALTMDNFVGIKWFTELFKNPATVRDIVRVLRNTLAMSGLGIATSWLPMAFAIFLCEIKNLRFRRFVQTFTTVPNFISWVLVYAIATCIFSTDGFISSLMVSMGVWDQGVNMLMGESHTWLKMLAWGLWKGIGWSAIVYISSISGIDQQLYEAATVDGAGRFARMWHITVPSLLPTFFVLLLMSVGNILSNGMDQYLVFENATNSSSIMVLDLYVYKLGIGQGQIPLSTVIGMTKSLVSVALLFTANGLSKKLRGESIM
ncbi:MAG: ABC transporter permease [Aristaeellaceae bacterium]